ncbi:MAG: insulinase family protein [Ignavibacteria bacterium]|nr:insulinase family protein [Ignavibacteria bacterium]
MIAEKLDRSIRPLPGAPKDIKFPGYFETTLPNGITVIVIKDEKFPIVSSRFVFKAGAFLDGDNFGISSFTSEMLTKGTANKSALEIAELIDYHGAFLSSGCDFDATFVSCYSLKKYFEKIFDITSEVILQPAFSDDEINRLREQKINSIISYKDEGDYLAARVFKKNVYAKLPYSKPLDGTEDTVSNFNRNDINNFYNSYYKPDNLIIAFVGDINEAQAVKLVEEKFGNFSGSYIHNSKIAEEKINDSKKVFIVNKSGAVQSSLKVGHLAFKRNIPDYIPASVMNTLLGGSFTSRINKNLREVNGFTYGARSYFDWKKHSGDFAVETEVGNSFTAPAVKEILFEVDKMRNELVSDEELMSVKNYLAGNFPLQLETPNAIASKVISLKIYDIDNDYYNTYISKVNDVTKQDINDAAVKYLHPEKMTIAIGGNPEAIKEDMKHFGDVEVLEDID